MRSGLRKKIFRTAFATAVSAAFLAGCSSTGGGLRPIEAVDFKGTSEVISGRPSEIAWEFKNADYVKVAWQVKNSKTSNSHYFSDTYNAKDTFRVTPREDRQLFVTAYNKNDSLRLLWHIFVKNENTPEPPVMTGGTPAADTAESGYFKGFTDLKNSSGPFRVKAMRRIYPYSGDSLCRVEAIVLDKHGNMIEGLDKGEVNWFSSTRTLAGGTEESILGLEETDGTGLPLDISVLIDNSAAASNSGVYSQLRRLINKLGKDDNINIYRFNHKLEQLVAASGQDSAFIRLAELPQLSPAGLNSCFRSARLALADLCRGRAGSRKALVIITYSTDNCSITYDADDVARFALSNQVPVYVLGIGTAVDSYSLKYLADYSGGRYYAVSGDDDTEPAEALCEIALSQKRHYSFNMTIAKKNKDKYEEINSEFSIQNGGQSADEHFRLIIRPETQFSAYQALAVFKYRDVFLDSAYIENFHGLVKMLADNPSLAIEIVGNSGFEGSEGENRSLSLARAQAVRRELLHEGVASSRIRLRGEGASKPIYLMANKEWQALYNRRVELRWLDPALLPFEILAQSAESETVALEKVEEWEREGYKSYYERVVSGGDVSYRVKLWGYATEADAGAALEKINRDKKSDYTLQ